MLQFFRMDKDAEGNDILTPVNVCAIQGDRIPEVPEKYCSALFYLGIADGMRVYIMREYSEDVPDGIMDAAEEWINKTPDKRALPTYFYDHIMINGVDRIAHLSMVYIAESEDAVWEFVNG